MPWKQMLLDQTIHGRVTEVREDGAGIINGGSTHGVFAGMELGNAVAGADVLSLRVIAVEEASAVVMTQFGGKLRPGLHVSSSYLEDPEALGLE